MLELVLFDLPRAPAIASPPFSRVAAAASPRAVGPPRPGDLLPTAGLPAQGDE
ncbi:hypothetical protein [Oryza sativa Japonica Group]|uniref:Uncharacterized protein n=2 Tax=Oryza sativa subsp. japonica TaxID=39947 RepID=Q5QLA3_ORYSJ|nr:hypothetical protein [Oryza sativa Japonica Group]BAD73803.1 hypothetical protein [Oryza sativa Japonica Group]